MPNLNSVTIVGHVGADAEMRFTPDGKAVANFNVAVTENKGDKDSQTEWLAVTCWEKLAETCNEHVKKGMCVLVQGRVHLDRWVDKDGVNRAKLAIAGNKVVFLSKRPESEAPENA